MLRLAKSLRIPCMTIMGVTLGTTQITIIIKVLTSILEEA